MVIQIMKSLIAKYKHLTQKMLNQNQIKSQKRVIKIQIIVMQKKISKKYPFFFTVLSPAGEVKNTLNSDK